MRNKKRILRAVASITMAAAMVGSVFAFTACNADDGNGGGGGGGGSQTNTYTITFNANGGKWGTETTKTDTTDANGKVTPPANPTRDDDATNTYTFVGWGMSADTAEAGKLDLGTKTFSTSTTLFAIWKATPKGEPGPGPSDTKTEKVKDKIAEADFTDDSAISSASDLAGTGFTAVNFTDKTELGGKAQDGDHCCEFKGSGSLTANSLKFTVPTAGKVKVTLKYYNGNDGRYIDVFAANTDPDTKSEKPINVYASSAATPTTKDKTRKDAVIYFWAEDGVTEYYLGSHNSGLYLASAKVETIVYNDDTAVEPSATEIAIYKDTTSYKLVNNDVTIAMNDVTVLTDLGTTPTSLGYTVATTIKDGESQDVAEGKAEKAGTYKVGATATKAEAATLTATAVDVTVSNVTSADVSVSTFNKDLMCEQSQTTVSFDVSTIKLLYGSTALAPAEDGPWTYSYTMANTAGEDTGFDGTAKTSFTLKQDCTYSLTVTATNSDNSIANVVKTVEGINVSAHAVRVQKQMTSWPGFTVNTVLLQNDADSDGKAEGELFKVTCEVAPYQNKTTAMNGDISSNHAVYKIDGDSTNPGNAIKFVLATGYTYKITIYAGSNDKSSASTLSLAEQQQTTGVSDTALACVFNIATGGTYSLGISGKAARIGGIEIIATKNA